MFSKKKIKKTWGYIEELASGPGWRVDRIVIKPGKRDKLHAQPSCRHSCYVESGVGDVYVGPKREFMSSSMVRKDNEFIVNQDWLHCYHNIGKVDLVIIQSSYGEFDLKEMGAPSSSRLKVNLF
jgi:mannose-1-phosphate guanylyltransferase